MSLKEAVYAEIFLNLWDKWRPGHYSGSQGLTRISEMNYVHLQNALHKLRDTRTIRANGIARLPSDGETIDDIKLLFENEEDLMSLKIEEMQRELDSREEEGEEDL